MPGSIRAEGRAPRFRSEMTRVRMPRTGGAHRNPYPAVERSQPETERPSTRNQGRKRDRRVTAVPAM